MQRGVRELLGEHRKCGVALAAALLLFGATLTARTVMALSPSYMSPPANLSSPEERAKWVSAYQTAVAEAEAGQSRSRVDHDLLFRDQ